MKQFTKRTLALAVGLTLPAAAFATNGMFMIGFGANEIGMGGAGVAFAQDAISSATNPATLKMVGNQFNLDVGLFSPRAEATSGNVTQKSDIGLGGDQSKPWFNNLYMMPAIAWSQQSGRWAYGFNFVPVGGGGSNYKKNLYQPNMNEPVGVSLLIAQFNPTIAYAFNRKNNFGASLVVGMQRFVAFGLNEFGVFTSSGNTSHLTDNGEDWSAGLGARIGWTGEFLRHNRLTLGASATSKVYMTRFHEYSTLFAGNGSFDTPANWIIGAAFKVTEKATVAFDVERYLYSGVPAISNPGPNSYPGPNGPFPTSKAVNALGQPAGLGFGWSNQTVYKLGLNYDINRKWIARAGWNYGKSPINQSTQILFNIVAPAVTQNHLTLGGTYRQKKNLEWDFAYMHAFTFKQYGPTYINSSGSIQMQQDSLDVEVNYKF